MSPSAWTNTLSLATYISLVQSSQNNENDIMSTVSLSIDISVWILSTFIFLSIECYWLYKTIKNSRFMIILKRKPGILLISICSSLIYVIINSTIIILNNHSILNIKLHTHTLLIIITCITFPLWYISVYFNCSRYWLLYFSIKWSTSCIKNKWYTIITASTHNDDWYLINKKTYGSWRWINKRLLYIILFCSVYNIAFIASMTLILMLLLVHVTFAVFAPLMFCIYLQSQIPLFDDNIGLREELQFCNYTVISIIMISILSQIIYFSYTDIFQYNNTYTNILCSLWFLLIRIAIFLINIKQTRWPLVLFKSVLRTRCSARSVESIAHQNTLKSITLAERQKLQSASDDILFSNTVFSLSPPSIGVKMTIALSDSSIFTHFMQRLLKEYSAECLLSMVEFIQFQKQCYIDFECDDEKIQIPSDISNNDYIILPNDDTFPQSYIVYRMMRHQDKNVLDIKDYKMIAKKLYDKYIKYGCEYEINIAGSLRKSYKELFENEEEWLRNEEYNDYMSLCKMFNPCIKQMDLLMSASFAQWVDTTEYKRLQQLN